MTADTDTPKSCKKLRLSLPVIATSDAITSYQKLRLSVVHSHLRDKRIQFLDAEHQYILDHKLVISNSVTKLVHQYINEFDARTTVLQYFHKWAMNANHKYFKKIQDLRRDGLSDEQIQQEIIAGWKVLGDEAREAGKHIHK